MNASLLRVVERVTLEQIRAARPAMIYYSANTLWWTHDASHLYVLINRRATPQVVARVMPPAPGAHQLPCDPRGSVLLQTENVEEWLSAAEGKPEHFGKHGLRAFLASHHLNSQLGVSERPWCSPSWGEYNDAIDRAIADGRMRP